MPIKPSYKIACNPIRPYQTIMLAIICGSSIQSLVKPLTNHKIPQWKADFNYVTNVLSVFLLNHRISMNSNRCELNIRIGILYKRRLKCMSFTVWLDKIAVSSLFEEAKMKSIVIEFTAHEKKRKRRRRSRKKNWRDISKICVGRTQCSNEIDAYYEAKNSNEFEIYVTLPESISQPYTLHIRNVIIRLVKFQCDNAHVVKFVCWRTKYDCLGERKYKRKFNFEPHLNSPFSHSLQLYYYIDAVFCMLVRCIQSTRLLYESAVEPVFLVNTMYWIRTAYTTSISPFAPPSPLIRQSRVDIFM